MASPLALPGQITSRQIETAAGLSMHVLEAGSAQNPTLLLLHGFPELAFSWRKVMVPLADAGFHVIAPDQRGYGRTTGWEDGYDCDLQTYAIPNLVRDAIALLEAMGEEKVHAVVGHDFGSPVAAWASLIRPDIFPRTVLMSSPFGGPPGIAQVPDPVHAELLALDRPRKHYQWYYATREAADNMLKAPQGLHSFFRAYYHMKSADWAMNRPHRLDAWSASELAKLPTYYVMDAECGMAETVAPEMPGPDQCAGCAWLTDDDVTTYANEYARTGFQASLNWYRCSTGPTFRRDLSVFAGRRIEGPVCFLSGASDWGYRQIPGALERLETSACADYRGTHLIDGAGHWVQQEQPAAVVDHILDFLDQT